MRVRVRVRRGAVQRPRAHVKSGFGAPSRVRYTLPSKASSTMVGVAQLAERQVVVLDVVGSSPITHPSTKPPGREGGSGAFSFSGLLPHWLLRAPRSQFTTVPIHTVPIRHSPDPPQSESNAAVLDSTAWRYSRTWSAGACRRVPRSASPSRSSASPAASAQEAVPTWVNIDLREPISSASRSTVASNKQRAPLAQ
jgi:hypothetical protein